jgi:hypothetical protein
MSIRRALGWPLRRLLDPRFGGLAEQADVQHLDLAERLEDLSRRVADGETIQQGLASLQRELVAIRHELVAMREQALALPAEELAEIRRELQADAEGNREATELLARTLGDVLAEVTATSLALEEALGRGRVDEVDTDLLARAASAQPPARSHSPPTDST